jgi:hypothetical protein
MGSDIEGNCQNVDILNGVFLFLCQSKTAIAHSLDQGRSQGGVVGAAAPPPLWKYLLLIYTYFKIN